MEPLRKIFKIGKEVDTAFKYIGIEMNQGWREITIRQDAYISSINEINIDFSLGLDKDRPVCVEEKKHFRSVVGQLAWSSSITRPDISFLVCELSTCQSSPKLSDLMKANKAIQALKTDRLVIRFGPIELKAARLVFFSDASHANLLDGGSQGGYIIFLCDASNNCCPLAWTSKRIKRVAKSTLSAETQSAIEAVETAQMLQQFLQEILPGVSLDVELYVDCKSLYDAINTTNLLSDKRLRIDIALLREMVERSELKVKWIQTKAQVADILTKCGPSRINLVKIL